MKLAEKFGVPVFTFVDTPGAYPGVGAEERGQSEAIGRNLYEMAELAVPIICTVIGEGGSGGALAIAVGDTTLMLQYCDLFGDLARRLRFDPVEKRGSRAEAAETLGITATRLKALGLIDKVVQRAARRRASRPRSDDAEPQEGTAGQLAAASRQAIERAPGSALREADRLWQVQGSRNEVTARTSSWPTSTRDSDASKSRRPPASGIERRRRLDRAAGRPGEASQAPALRAPRAARQPSIEPQCRALGAVLSQRLSRARRAMPGRQSRCIPREQRRARRARSALRGTACSTCGLHRAGPQRRRSGRDPAAAAVARHGCQGPCRHAISKKARGLCANPGR